MGCGAEEGEVEGGGGGESVCVEFTEDCCLALGGLVFDCPHQLSELSSASHVGERSEYQRHNRLTEPYHIIFFLNGN